MPVHENLDLIENPRQERRSGNDTDKESNESLSAAEKTIYEDSNDFLTDARPGVLKHAQATPRPTTRSLTGTYPQLYNLNKDPKIDPWFWKSHNSEDKTNFALFTLDHQPRNWLQMGSQPDSR